MRNSILPLLLLLFAHTLPAEISIAEIKPSAPMSCTGGFTVRADGTAGPFTIIVPGQIKGEPDQVFTNVTNSVVLQGLCNGNYEVRVFPTRFPTCVTLLEAELKDPKEKAVDEETIGDFTLEVSPNPTTGKVTLSCSSGKTTAEATENNWTIMVSNVNGGIVEERKMSGKTGIQRQVFNLDLSEHPRGVYFIQVTHRDGGQLTRQVVVQ